MKAQKVSIDEKEIGCDAFLQGNVIVGYCFIQPESGCNVRRALLPVLVRVSNQLIGCFNSAEMKQRYPTRADDDYFIR